MKSLLLILIAAFVHFALQQVGSNFLIPFGYASLIWPLAGVMLGLYLLFGFPVIVGVLLSSIISLSTEYYAVGTISVIELSSPIIQTLQLLIAKLLINKFCTLPVNSKNPMAIVQFLVLTGPLTCFITASIGTGILAYSDNLAVEALLFIGSSKWVGDLVSIVFLTPVFLFLYPNNIVKKARKPFSAITATLIVLFTVYVINALINLATYADTKREFVNETRQLQERFKFAEASIKSYLMSLNGLITADLNITKQQFEQFSSQILHIDEVEGSPLIIRGLGWAPIVEQQDRENFEQQLVTNNALNHMIRELSSEGWKTSEVKAQYMPIKYLYPFEENRAALGLDLLAHPVVSSSVTQAIEENKVVISSILALAQQQDIFNAVVAYAPVYNQNSTSALGVVEVVIELDRLVKGLYNDVSKDLYGFQFIFDDYVVSNKTAFNGSSAFTHQVYMSIFNKQVTFKFSSTAKFEKRLADWSSLWVMIIGSVIGVVCVMFVFFIVTFNASLTNKVNASTAKLTRQNEELNRANQAKNLFLANISHEYRTPLNAIVGFSEIAERENTDKRLAEYLQHISQSSNILLGIVNDVLDSSKMQAGELKLERCDFSIYDASRSVVSMLDKKAKEKNITIEQKYDSEREPWVSGDETRYKQILINLLNNAIKFTSHGTISIAVDIEELDNNFYQVALTVKDSGIGIEPELQAMLFKPFAQAEDSTSRKYGGTGLGLSIVKQLAELMSGEVSLSSEVGKGSEFKVLLTLNKAQRKELQKDPDYHVIELEFATANVLVVEDNKINQMVVQKQLQTLGIECDLADDGEKALKYLATSKPDLILMDLQMPIMDGFTVSERIKSDEKLNHIPIVILSASVGAEEKQRASSLGITDFVNKPFTQQELAQVLSKYLKQH